VDRFYLIGAALPLAVLVAYYGWEAGRTGLDISDGEEMRAAAWLGLLWPLVLVALAMFAVPFAISWIVRRFSDAQEVCCDGVGRDHRGRRRHGAAGGAVPALRAL
jgi:hypothetical protein